MKLGDILRCKGANVHTISLHATLGEVVRALVRFNIGSLVVCDAGDSGNERMVGIITERDILRTQAACQTSLDQMMVRDVFSSNLITARPDDSIGHAMALMTRHRVRHLPVVEGDNLHGLISIGDLVKAHHDELEMENHFMKSYIQGEGAEITTAAEITTVAEINTRSE